MYTLHQFYLINGQQLFLFYTLIKTHEFGPSVMWCEDHALVYKYAHAYGQKLMRHCALLTSQSLRSFEVLSEAQSSTEGRIPNLYHPIHTHKHTNITKQGLKFMLSQSNDSFILYSTFSCFALRLTL